ncbi:MAG: hypothetical protein LBS55_14520 [Prevotellaceae bacterium]|jgi:hypothetical protein|nr:hypothetical protein [Prevotellaceae bacterium]
MTEQVEKNKAIQTFIQTIEKIGIEKVEQLKDNIVRADKNLSLYDKRISKLGLLLKNTYSSNPGRFEFNGCINNVNVK